MQKVIIVGATSGIGRALAILYAKNNCMVGVTGRRKAMLDSLQQEFPDNIVTECFDVTKDENIDSIKNLIQQLGGLNLLVYNSGYGERSQQLDWVIDKHTTDVNVNGFVEIVNFVFNYFVREGKGHIAAISSISSTRGNSFAPAYSASKAYMSTYMEGLYLKASRLKIPLHITDIQPGFVKTNMAKSNDLFWVATADKAAQQIYTAIENKQRKAYITKRWRLIAILYKLIPISILRKFG